MDKKITITEIVKAKLCTGCGTCVPLCPNSAIEIIINKSEGIYNPRLDEQKCNQCGICSYICPRYSVEGVKDASLGNYLNCFMGYAIDNDIRYNSSSGGLITSVLSYALEEGIIDGALVTRMKEDTPLEPESFIARTVDEIIESSGSKYCPVPANTVLSKILKQDGKYAVVGLPCHIHGIRKAEMINKKLKDRIVLHLGIFCSGFPNFKATEFLLYRLNLHADEIKKLNYRGNGWPGKISIYLKNGEVKLMPYPEYWVGSGNQIFPCNGCAECIDWFSNLADISFGDAWLPEIKKDDKIGTSIIISRTKQIDDILHQMVREGVIALSEIDADKIYKSQPGFFRKKRRIASAYNCDILHRSLFYDRLISSLVYSQRVIASKRSLWWLLCSYNSFLYISSRINSKLKR